MDNTRAKLIELFAVTSLEFEEAVTLADYLIANGVTLHKHGRWIVHNKGQNNWVECSECNTVGSPFWKRCPICEAKMEVDLNGI